MSSNEQNKKKGSNNSSLQLLRAFFVGVFSIHRIPGALKDNKKALKTKNFLYPLLCLVYVVCLIAAPVCLLLALLPVEDQFTPFLLFIPALGGLILSIKYKKIARAKLAFFCDDCFKAMDYNYSAACKKTETVRRTEKVVTGSHYNVTSNDDGSLDVRKVIDTETRTKGSFKVNNYEVCATLTCPVCSKKSEYIVACNTYGNDSVASKAVKDAVIQKIISKNAAADHELFQKKAN